jgi:hypothetical protein
MFMKNFSNPFAVQSIKAEADRVRTGEILQLKTDCRRPVTTGACEG